MTATRLEKDTFGPIAVPADRLWGAQTQRSLHNFAISGERQPREIIHALAQVKKASATVNQRLGLLDASKAGAIIAAADEVLANRASEILGGPRGEGRLIHPNDDVNKSQSSNDVFPTAMHVAAVTAIESRLLPAIARLRATLQAKSEAFADIVKIGRTHLQDATPLTLGQEISGWAAQLAHGEQHVRAALPHLYELALGGTVVFGVVDVMQEIVDSVQSVAAIMSEISQATQSQSQGIAQINQAVVDMEGSTQQNTALVEEAAAVAASLREQARLLAQMVNGFQLQQTTETQGLRQIGPA